MKMNKALSAMVETARQSDSYWVEQAKLDFALALEQRRRAANMTGADIAAKIGTSAAYISKVFRGDSNYTIETMVTKPKLTLIAGGITTQINPVPGHESNWLAVVA
ncbi:MAG: helix-turn-helix transcriptional regulator [Rhodoferax sp.]|jgi:hypothetical protein|uniref:helix-turn-helix domain-containing protein n=2 Tax=Rhodoferax sp. TaxID=50421 RepID=UPI003C77E573